MPVLDSLLVPEHEGIVEVRCVRLVTLHMVAENSTDAWDRRPRPLRVCDQTHRDVTVP